jgi:DNA-binding CsgD family transcriptional regulator
VDSERLMGALGRLYDATVVSDDLVGALNHFADLFQASEACLLNVDKLRNCALGIDWGRRVYSVDACQDYCDHYVQIDDARFALEKTPLGTVFNDVEHVSQDRVERSAFYQDFLRRHGARYILSSNLINSPQQISGLSLHRSPKAGAFGDAEATLMARAVPHLQRIARLRVRLDQLESQVAGNMAALDGLAFGIGATDETGRLVLTNAVFEQSLAENDGLAVRGGMLQAATPAWTAHLGDAITEAVSASAGQPLARPGTGLRLPRPSGRRPWALVVMTLPWHSVLAHRESPGALLVLTDPEAARPTPARQLVELFGLTPGEARLAERLLQVDSLAAAAEMSGVTVATARYVLKQIFHKTDTHSQPELVKRVLQSPIGHLDLEEPGHGD